MTFIWGDRPRIIRTIIKSVTYVSNMYFTIKPPISNNIKKSTTAAYKVVTIKIYSAGIRKRKLSCAHNHESDISQEFEKKNRKNTSK